MSSVDLAVEADTEGPPGVEPGRYPVRRALAALALRLHFYAGVFVAPFILVAAVTGALYSVAPTVESIVNHDLLHVDSTGPARPLAEQVAAARDAEPDLELSAVDPAQRGGDTTRVLFTDPGLGESERRAVFVDPQTAHTVGDSVVYGSSGALPLRTWIDQLHRTLHLGQIGRLYSELAASWLWVVALAGLVLWLRRSRSGGARRMLWPDRSRPGRHRTTGWHAAVGVWILLPLLFLSATGMTWSTYAGDHIDRLRAQLGWTTPSVRTALPGNDVPGAHAAGEHDHHAGPMSPATGRDGTTAPADRNVRTDTVPTPGRSDRADTVPPADHGNRAEAAPPADAGDRMDVVFAAARAQGLDGPVEISVPDSGGDAFTVEERRLSGVLTQDAVAVDGSTGAVVDTVRYADWPVMAKLANWGIQLHMGLMFGLANQLLLLATMIGLLTVVIRGYLMWWQRRPTRSGRRSVAGKAPRRGVLRRTPLTVLTPLVVIAAVVGWFAPLIGVPLLAFLAVDTGIGLLRHNAVA
ncbi:PepSY-associated TM helix domain-containing protein [Nocardia sp. alder85J]|uniref:PepSY-associated TM helix domain-containing protein n=1 Tax=Nocardia sp. alder85J TaxID=2862949 RepID=UPI001CD7E088|nr:PepSY domain-containing protein [Nocardia sp. alder85J]MCX4096970.1 PepSY domain-containing protein [Nocardia sp. alder85J]